jgi:hypothetical protein
MESPAPSTRGTQGRKVVLLVILTVFTFLLLMMSQREERDLEDALMAGDVQTVWHDDQLMEGITITHATQDTTKDQTQSLSQSASTQSAELTTASFASTQSTELLIGFHSPSPQSFIDRAIHYKPKGVGYALRPVGGLHPTYYLDLVNDSSLETSADGDYSLFSPYADARLQLSNDERQKEQSQYIQKLQYIREEWGYWNFKDTFYKGVGTRPYVDWDNMRDKKQDTQYDAYLGEIDREDFEQGVWQGDDQ